MTKDEIIKKLRDMAKYPTVTLPRDCEALKAAADLLEQKEAKDEPVAWVDATGFIYKIKPEPVWPEVQPLKPLYITPSAQRQWVGLTDEEIKPLCDENHIIYGAYTVDFAQAIEAKLKEKNS